MMVPTAASQDFPGSRRHDRRLGFRPARGRPSPEGARPLARRLFWNGVRVTLTRPRQAWQFFRTVRWQAAAAKTRAEWQKRGLQVPPIIIFSITHQCNLPCAGCYARFDPDLRSDGPSLELTSRDRTNSATPGSAASWPKRTILVSHFSLSQAASPSCVPRFSVSRSAFRTYSFSYSRTACLVESETVTRLARLRNVIPMLSLEGTATETDERRGEGTYRRLMERHGTSEGETVFFGCSLTLTSRNFSNCAR